MSTTTWATMRGEILRPLGFEDFTLTTTLAANNLATSTELCNRWPSDDYFIGWYLLFVADADADTKNDGVIRRVTDYVGGSTGVLTVAGAALTADDSSKKASCELSTFHPADVLRAYNRARQNVFPQLSIVRNTDTIVTGPGQTLFTIPSSIRKVLKVYVGNRLLANNNPLNILSNADFETWTNATTPTGWAISGGGASVNQEAATTDPANYAVLSGNNSARIVVPSTTVTALTQTVTPSVGMEGMEINVSLWVYCNTADRVSAFLDAAGSTYHGGTGWERLTMTLTLGATDTNVEVGVGITSGTALALYVDEVIAIVGPTEALEPFWTPLLNFEQIPPVAGASNAGLLYVREALPEKQALRIVGTDMLTAATADSSTVELDGNLLEPLYHKIRQFLCEERAKQSRGDQRIEWSRLQSEYRTKYEEAITNGHRLELPRKLLKAPDQVL